MTQDTAHTPLDERALEAAREQPGTNHDGIIRAYLQTAAADVSGLVPVAYRARHSAVEKWCLFSGHVSWWECQPLYAASTLQTLSASNAALEAENERLRVALRQTEYLLTKDSFSAAERLSEGLAHVRQARAALSAPKGGQDHG